MARTRFSERSLGRRALAALFAVMFSSNLLHADPADECLLFSERVSFTVADVDEVLTGDFDGDGTIELLILDGPAEEQYATWFHIADETFVEGVTVLLPSVGLGENALGDFNGDGLLDIVRLLDDGRLVVTLLQDGAGEFVSTPVLDVTGILDFPVSGDVTGDGFDDLIARNSSTFILRVYPGSPDGLTGEERDEGDGESRSVVIDMDADDDLDLYSFGVLFRNDGSGSFAREDIHETGGQLQFVADFDVDGDPDIVIWNSADSLYSFHANRGDGTVDPPVESNGSFSTQWDDDAIGDIDGDGDPDVVRARPSSGGQVVLVTNGGDGTFSESLLPFPAPDLSVLLVDVLGDEFVDVVRVNRDILSDNLRLLVSANVNGTLTPFVQSEVVELGLRASALDVADVDRDGDLDPLISHNKNINQFWLMRNDGGTLTKVVHEVDAAASDIAAADFNGDGWPDVAVASSFEVVIFENDGSGTFSISDRHPVFEESRVLVELADVDADGATDLLVAAAHFLGGGYATVLWNDGFGDFTAAPLAVPVLAAYSLVAGDMDGDGRLDLVVVDGDDQCDCNNRVRVLRNEGGRDFSEYFETALPDVAGHAATADLNGDGLVDLALATVGDWCSGGDVASNVLVMLNEGGSFGPTAQYLAWTAGRLLVHDLNSDGASDILASNICPGTPGVTLLIGSGDGAFRSILIPAGGDEPRDARIVDFDQDGRDELLLVNAGQTSTFGFLTIVETLVDYVDILTQPAERISAVEGQPLVLAATADGLGELTYQWSRDGTPLSDDGRIAGAQSPTLTIDPLACDDAGEYTVAVSGTCNTASSDGTRITVFPATACALASVDCSAADIAPEGALDCIVDLADVGAVLANYEPGAAGKSRAQGDVFPPCAGDGIVDLADLGQVLAAFGADCN